ncbi:MAG: hypothetical protein AB7P40_20815 [Chloroflexota bacterium]
MGDPQDLIDRLVCAAEAAIRNERPTIDRAGVRVRGLVVDLAIDRLGRVSGGSAYIEVAANVRPGSEASR